MMIYILERTAEEGYVCDDFSTVNVESGYFTNHVLVTAFVAEEYRQRRDALAKELYASAVDHHTQRMVKWQQNQILADHGWGWHEAAPVLPSLEDYLYGDVDNRNIVYQMRHQVEIQSVKPLKVVALERSVIDADV